jgi:CRISPR-associated protein Cmr3
MDPAVSLAYLSSHSIDDGVYRFGGEGHLVEITTYSVPTPLRELLSHDQLECFSLITPGVWGSSRLSRREPEDQRPAHERFGQPAFPFHSKTQGPGILTERPRSWRHHLGRGTQSSFHSEQRAGVRRLSRGRWAMVAGSCYQLPPGHSLLPWARWSDDWFPREGFSFKRLGTGLALPLHPEGP